MARLNRQRTPGISDNGLRAWGLIILIVGIIGRSLLQFHTLGVGKLSTGELFEAMQASDDVMIIATLALIFQILETCAMPIYAFLTAQGFDNTSNFPGYVLRMAGLALLCEIPYNLAFSGQVLDLSCRNPVFGLVLALVVLFFYRYYEGPSAKNVIIKVLVSAAALLWTVMLKIEFGGCLLLLTCVFWIFRARPTYRDLAGATAAVVCCLSSPIFLAAPMGVLVIHFYNGEKGADNRLVNYLSYPVALLVIGLFGMMGL